MERVWIIGKNVIIITNVLVFLGVLLSKHILKVKINGGYDSNLAKDRADLLETVSIVNALLLAVAGLIRV